MKNLKEVIIFSQAAGGMGRTSMAHAIANVLADKKNYNKKVLMLDFTSFGDLTLVQIKGEIEDKLKESILNVNAKGNIISVDENENLYLLPNNMEMMEYDVLNEFFYKENKEKNVLAKMIEESVEELQIEYIIVDTSTVGTAIFQELIRTDFGVKTKIVAPSQIDYRIEGGLESIEMMLEKANQETGLNLQIENLVLLKRGRIAKFEEAFLEKLEEKYGEKITKNKYIFNAKGQEIWNEGYEKATKKEKENYKNIVEEIINI